MAVLRAALEQEEALAPRFEAELDRILAEFDVMMETAETEKQYISMGKKLFRKPSPLFYGFLLAAEWKRKQAYSRYAELLRWSWAGNPNVLSETLFCDLGPRVMAELYDGDPEPLYKLMLDPGADELIRFWQFRTFILLVEKGAMDKETLRAFLVRCFKELEQEPDMHVWYGWEEVIVYFGFFDLIPLAEHAHSVQRIRDRTIEDFREDYAYARAHPEEPVKGCPVVAYQDFEDAVAEAVANR